MIVNIFYFQYATQTFFWIVREQVFIRTPPKGARSELGLCLTSLQHTYKKQTWLTCHLPLTAKRFCRVCYLNVPGSVHLPERPRVCAFTWTSQGLCIYLNVPGSEEELSVEIRFLDDVHVGDCDLSTLLTSHAHHRPVLQHFTPYCTRPDLCGKKTQSVL